MTTTADTLETQPGAALTIRARPEWDAQSALDYETAENMARACRWADLMDYLRTGTDEALWKVCHEADLATEIRQGRTRRIAARLAHMAHAVRLLNG